MNNIVLGMGDRVMEKGCIVGILVRKGKKCGGGEFTRIDIA